ncbi:MAG: hypothetical protein J0I13_15925, partial [Rhizobiales bacterium]|nr:hypothetical protein [Hyphomicrobiales bacterium]
LGIVVAGIDSGQERARVARDLIEWGFAYFEPRQIFPAGASFGTASVQDGSNRSVGLRTIDPIIVDLPHGARTNLTLTLRYKGPIKAPIRAGDAVAELEVKGAGFETYRVPLEASSDVAKANPLRRIWNGVLGVFS